MRRSVVILGAVGIFAACKGDDTAADSRAEASASYSGSGGDDSSGAGSADDESAEGSATGNSDDGTTSSGGDESSGDGSTGGDPECMNDDDCAGDVANPVCLDGECVPCTPENDVCPVGFYCTQENDCMVGCLDGEDCPDDLVCDVDNNLCTGCVGDFDCPLGSVCEDNSCVPGCTDEQPCQAAFTCCTGDCFDLLDDVNNCGGCGTVCDPYANADTECNDGMCQMGACANGFNDCNLNPMDGCETDEQCACAPGEKIACYTGLPEDTEDVGACHGGERTCNDQGTGFGACLGEVIPGLEICANGEDENCDGNVDENMDIDMDGWGVCDNDCCDELGPNCQNPELVNPGAFEFDLNGVDDDCDGNTDNPIALCDAGLASNSNVPNDYVKAIDLCQFTTENPPLEDKIWGVISSGLHRANGAGAPATMSRSIRPGFGTNIVPELGQSISVLSSGRAADVNDANPAYAAFQTGQSMGTSSAFPADWFAANGNQLPNTPGCPNVAGGTANDPVMLKARIRVPTNAQSFSTKMFFFSAEYPEYVCTAFNDFFVALVDSTDNTNPADKNIAIKTVGMVNYAMGVNILKASPDLFTQCNSANQISHCVGAVAYNGCLASNELIGTGFDVNASACGYNGRIGGGTSWLKMSGNVDPGETMEIRFVIWDSSDSVWDSLVLLDDFEWSVQASQPGVEPG